MRKTYSFKEQLSITDEIITNGMVYKCSTGFNQITNNGNILSFGIRTENGIGVELLDNKNIMYFYFGIYINSEYARFYGFEYSVEVNLSVSEEMFFQDSLVNNYGDLEFSDFDMITTIRERIEALCVKEY